MHRLDAFQIPWFYAITKRGILTLPNARCEFILLGLLLTGQQRQQQEHKKIKKNKKEKKNSKNNNHNNLLHLHPPTRTPTQLPTDLSLNSQERQHDAVVTPRAPCRIFQVRASGPLPQSNVQSTDSNLDFPGHLGCTPCGELTTVGSQLRGFRWRVSI